MINRLDDYLLATTERAVHAVQRLTGVTSIQLALVLHRIVFLSFVTLALSYWFPLIVAPDPGGLDHLVIGLIGMACFGRADRKLSHAARKWPGDALPSELLSFRGVDYPLMRLIPFGIFTALLVFDLRSVLWQHKSVFARAPHVDVALSLIQYVLWVDPLPPGVSKVRQWLSTLSFGLVAKPLPTHH